MRILIKLFSSKKTTSTDLNGTNKKKVKMTSPYFFVVLLRTITAVAPTATRITMPKTTTSIELGPVEVGAAALETTSSFAEFGFAFPFVVMAALGSVFSFMV